MCRSIQQLRRRDEMATDAEIQAAARQFVRKVSGYRTPSRANQDAFEQAVAEIAAATHRLLVAVNKNDGRAQAAGSERIHAQQAD